MIKPLANHDYSQYSDVDCLAAVEAFVKARRERNRPIPRTVKIINQLGYAIDRETYKRLENRPLTQVEHIRAGILNYAYASLENNPAIHQDAYTYATMQVIADYRREAGYSYADMSNMITTAGYPVTESEYRTCEEGTTKRVPLGMVCQAMLTLRITPERAFESIMEAFATGDY